ncbi:hypothetical protein EZ449_09270 [Pedobacter frigidisoli]|uniref:Uncharacterized protein n=1 Tax=Pedobacter frigidisoli TaxID=2530455 RepID=A0A4R0P197_9SPHI|nr:hypothetical protein [Pedobacter frigidisoli]TCD10525.1 hypothetical protein EZ449_09270 [Pedobacter frigidisoli]
MKKEWIEFTGRWNKPCHVKVSHLKNIEPLKKGTRVTLKNDEVLEFKNDYESTVFLLRSNGYHQF